MQYKCQECNDTGSRDKIGAYFDCNACGTAATRRDLNDFVKSLTKRSTYPVHPEDVALAIHQRALAMAPKQEAIKVEDERAAFDTWYDATPSRQAYAWDAWKHRASVAAPAAANGALPELPEPLEIYWPELHSSAFGCGVEDRGLHDRYECAEYGWQDGVDKSAACVPDAIYDADQMRTYGQVCHAMGRGAAVREYVESGTFKQPVAAAGPDAALVALIHKAQSILTHHLPPDGPDAKTTISELLGLLDGPESRAALKPYGDV